MIQYSTNQIDNGIRSLTYTTADGGNFDVSLSSQDEHRGYDFIPLHLTIKTDTDFTVGDTFILYATNGTDQTILSERVLLTKRNIIFSSIINFFANAIVWADVTQSNEYEIRIKNSDTERPCVITLIYQLIKL